MVITCPTCSSRYRLSDGRIKGPGAKVTCPRCAHVFVVSRSAEAATETGSIRIVNPGPRGSRVEVATVTTGTLPAVPPDDPVDAFQLDFAEVGIRTWKVRRTIGLTYDFSDLRTFNRYVADGRVGPDDELSPDGKTWIALGDIDDLEQHFIDAWKAARDAGGAPPPKKASPPPSEARSQSFSPPRATPPTAASRRPRRVPPPEPAESPTKMRLLRTLVVVGLGLAAYLGLRSPPLQHPEVVEQVVEAPDQPTPEDVDERAARIRSAIDRDMPTTAPAAPAPPPPEEPAAPRGEYLAPPSARVAAGDNWFDGGRQAMLGSNFGLAQKMFQRAVDRVPNDPRYWEALGEAQVELGLTAAAADSFIRAEELGGLNAVR